MSLYDDNFQQDTYKRQWIPESGAWSNRNTGVTGPKPPPHIQNDYWAPDRDEVLKDPTRWGAPAPPAPTAPAPPPAAPGMSREQYRDAWMGSGVSDIGGLKNWLGQNGGTLVSETAGTVRTPHGELLDMLINASGTGPAKAGWTATYDPDAAKYGVTSAGAAQGVGVGGATAGSVGSASASGSSSVNKAGVSDELYNLLMGRAKQGLGVGRDDPNVRAQVDPLAAQMERTQRNYIADLAEKAGPLANIRGEERLASERAGQAAGTLESEVIGREIAARRDEIRNALDSLRDQLSEDQRLALTRELALLDDATRRYGIDTEADLGRGSLALGRDNLGYNIGRTDMDFWLRTQGL